MSISNVLIYYCDTEKCKNRLETHAFDAKDDLNDAGWIVGRYIGDDDYCPVCAAEQRGGESE